MTPVEMRAEAARLRFQATLPRMQSNKAYIASILAEAVRLERAASAAGGGLRMSTMPVKPPVAVKPLVVSGGLRMSTMPVGGGVPKPAANAGGGLRMSTMPVKPPVAVKPLVVSGGLRMSTMPVGGGVPKPAANAVASPKPVTVGKWHSFIAPRMSIMPVKPSAPLTGAKPPGTNVSIMPVAVAPESKEEARRRTLVNTWKNKPAFSGTVTIDGKPVRILAGVFSFDGGDYAISKDGRAVIDRHSLLIIGEVVGGAMRKPSAAFLQEMSVLGGVV